MACQCASEYAAITEQLVRIADALEASNAAAPDLFLSSALLQAIITDEHAFADVQGYATSAKMHPGTALKELVDTLKVGYNA